jgi:hypothetical protein
MAELRSVFSRLRLRGARSHAARRRAPHSRFFGWIVEIQLGSEEARGPRRRTLQLSPCVCAVIQCSCSAFTCSTLDPMSQVLNLACSCIVYPFACLICAVAIASYSYKLVTSVRTHAYGWVGGL